MKDSQLRRFLGLTWAGWLNCLILQWSGFRLQRVVEDDDEITGWRIRWCPIWRAGWSLPTFRRRQQVPVPLSGKAVYRVAGRGRAYLLPPDDEVRPGDVVKVTARGLEAVAADPNAPIGRIVSAVPAGGTALLEFDFGEERDA